MAKAGKNVEPIETPNEELSVENNVETAIVSAPAPVSTLALNKALADRLPPDHRDRERVLMMERPSPSALIEKVASLDGTWQDRVLGLVRKMRPSKQGLHVQGSGFKVTDIKLYHGVGSDASRPAKLAPGCFYTSDSRSLDDKFVAAVIAVHEPRTLWPPMDGQRARPLCSSLDQRQGSAFGACATCKYSSLQWSKGGCAPEVQAFVIDQEMTGIYSIKFTKTSHRSGTHLTKLIAGDDELWSRWIQFSSTEYKEGTKRWYGIQAAPIDAKNAAEIFTPKSLDPVFRSMSQALDAEVYYPALADQYDRAKAPQLGAGGTSGDTFDEPMTDAGVPDFSNA